MQPFSLSMVENTGSLLIRDAAEPYALQTPTTISGSHDTGEAEGGVTPTGAVTNGSFSSPAVSFETEALGYQVFVDATFSQVTSASATGVIDADGNVRLVTSLTVDLHIDVPPILVNDCRATPVNLVLESTAPWDPETKRVTVTDADFSVPPVPVTDPTCISLVADNVNSLLAGGGHSLTMTLEGDLTLPPAPGCPTLTDVEVSPEDQTGLGDGVTFTATVAADPAFADDPLCEDADPGQIPAGIVAFREGTRTLGTAELDGTGTATFTATALPVGSFALSAAYRGSPPFAGSASGPVAHQVTAKPVITADMPAAVRIGADPVTFDVTVANSSLGATVSNARPQLTLRSLPPANGILDPVMEYSTTGSGGPFIPASFIGPEANKAAALGPANGFTLPAGEAVTFTIRLSLASAAEAGPAVAIFELMEVDPVTGLPDLALPNGETVPASPGRSPDALVTVRAPFAKVNAARHAPPWSATFQPHTVRQGQTVRVNEFNQSPNVLPDGLSTEGTVTVLFDGKPVPIRTDFTSPAFGYLPSVEKGIEFATSPEFVVPIDAPTGPRVVTVLYAGNEFFEPAQVSGMITVLPARGVSYTCAFTHIASDRFAVNLVGSAFVPSVAPAGSTVGLLAPDLTLFGDRGPTAANISLAGLGAVSAVGPVPSRVESIAFEFAGGTGSGSASAVTTANRTPLPSGPADPATVDLALGFNGETASVTIAGVPGEVVPVTVDRIRIAGTFFGATKLGIDCEPLGDPVVLGEITVSGTTLSVDAPSPTRAGDVVTLSAQVQPLGVAGPVEFFSGATSIGMTTLNPADGTASITTTGLTPGPQELTARFYGGTALVSTTSAPVALEVLVATECAAFAEEGNEAVARLVYMELLGRCPDEAGFDYWVGRLDGGTSPEVFARTIARTPEAVGRVVDDAYRTMLGRSADAPGRAFWVDRVLTGSGRYDTLLASLGASDEFWSKAGSSNTGFVTRVYESLLNRAPDQAGQDYWVGRLDGGTSRGSLIVSLANLDEPLRVLVTDSFDEILSRTPTSSELSDGVTFLRSTGDRSGLYARLIGTDEFFDRAQGFPNPED